MTQRASLPDSTDDARQRRTEQNYYRQFAQDREAADVFVLSYPKAGRTWHRLMVGHYLVQLCGASQTEAMSLDRLCSLAGVRRAIYSHNGANFLDLLPPSSPVVACPSMWRDRHVLLLVRDPRDIVVSAYHHAMFRSHTISGSLSSFIRDPRVGIEKILTAFNRWHANRHLALSFDVFSYEAMHRAPDAILGRMLEALGINPIDEDMVARSVAFCAFANMRSYEETNLFRSPRLHNAIGDSRANKVRTGKVGGYREHLSTEDLLWVAECVGRLGDPFERLYGEWPGSRGNTR